MEKKNIKTKIKTWRKKSDWMMERVGGGCSKWEGVWRGENGLGAWC